MLCGGGPCRGLRRGGIIKVGFDELSSVWQGGKSHRSCGERGRWRTRPVGQGHEGHTCPTKALWTLFFRFLCLFFYFMRCGSGRGTERIDVRDFEVKPVKRRNY